MKKLKKIKNNLVYYSAVIFIRIFNLIPRSMAISAGVGLGFLAYLVSGRDRAKARMTLKMVYGERLDNKMRRRIIRNLYINFGRNLIEVFRFKKFYRRQISSLIDVEGLEYFDRVYKRGKGVIAVTGHIGNFELLAVFFANSGYKAAVIGREMYDPRLNRLLVNNRESLGIINIDTRDSPRRILKVLKEGCALGVLIDTDSMRVRSEFVPAFGIPAYAPVGQSIIGLKTGAGFVPMACVRNGRRYKIIIRPEVIIERSDDFKKDVYNITALCTRALDEIIDQHRDQWIWIHNRWHTRPKEPI
nr:hypothetical protein [candidate division Zixibacteria bacterium]